MQILQNIKKTRLAYVQSQDGSFGVMAACVSLMLIVAIGVAIDMSKLQGNQSKAQALADNVGLAAAVYIRDNEVPPTDQSDGFVEGVEYDIKSLDIINVDNTLSGIVTVDYDQQLQKAIVNVDGEYKTSFMQAFYQPTVPVKALSSVNYAADSVAPTSVFLVVDASASMAFSHEPANGGSSWAGGRYTQRIDALKSTLLNFTQDISEKMKNENGDTLLRMAFIPYSDGVNENYKTAPKWGAIISKKIKYLYPYGSTDSAPALTLASQWMSSESSIHKEAYNMEPKKYVIFLADGMNMPNENCQWRNKKRTRLWRRQKDGSYYEYKYSRFKPAGKGWKEGYKFNCYEEYKSDELSLEQCDLMKNNGIDIFTIGFSTEPGYYYTNTRYNNTTYQSPETTRRAYDFLETCASSSEHFLKAENETRLKEAFETINTKINQGYIRVSQ